MPKGKRKRHGHLELQLKGGESTAAVLLDLVGTGKTGRVYLGAYSGDAGSYEYHGSLDESARLLRWFERGAAIVRQAIDAKQKRERIQRRVRKAGR